MRVIAGEAKGKPLKAPKAIRPTTDLVKGAIFSMLEALGGGWERVLDLYSGSGALGIEALSRGAGWADFVEKEPRNCSVIKDNLEKTGFKEHSHVYCCSVKRALEFLEGDYSLVLMDPPYAMPGLEGLVGEVALSPRLKKGSFLVVSHSSRTPLPPQFDGLMRIKERQHGDTAISIYQKGAP
ncbi:MAG TPA: RsmD family RNA methyltransferase [Dehalococcoidia bacterium]|nr:RsmD family RNA methyltransferase [Dehalococcoidia bacterium]